MQFINTLIKINNDFMTKKFLRFFSTFIYANDQSNYIDFIIKSFI